MLCSSPMRKNAYLRPDPEIAVGGKDWKEEMVIIFFFFSDESNGKIFEKGLSSLTSPHLSPFFSLSLCP